MNKILQAILMLSIVSTASLWVWSETSENGYCYDCEYVEGYSVRMEGENGQMLVEFSYYPPDHLSAEHSLIHCTNRDWFDFSCYLRKNSPPDASYETRLGFIFPIWSVLVVLVCFLVFVLWKGPLRRRRRRKQGLCIHCGYDLRGTSETGCPECGEGYSQSGDAGIGEDGI